MPCDLPLNDAALNARRMNSTGKREAPMSVYRVSVSYKSWYDDPAITDIEGVEDIDIEASDVDNAQEKASERVFRTHRVGGPALNSIVSVCQIEDDTELLDESNSPFLGRYKYEFRGRRKYTEAEST